MASPIFAHFFHSGIFWIKYRDFNRNRSKASVHYILNGLTGRLIQVFGKVASLERYWLSLCYGASCIFIFSFLSPLSSLYFYPCIFNPCCTFIHTFPEYLLSFVLILGGAWLFMTSAYFFQQMSDSALATMMELTNRVASFWWFCIDRPYKLFSFGWSFY